MHSQLALEHSYLMSGTWTNKGVRLLDNKTALHLHVQIAWERSKIHTCDMFPA